VITAIEELSLNAWPAHQTLLYDGWLLRFANGYTKRANSVNPIYSSTLDVDEKIAFCERIYQAQKLDVVYKLTSACFPENLDDILAAGGYQKDSPTSVQLLEMISRNVELARETELQESLSDNWLDAFCRMSAVDEQRRKSLLRILSNIVPRTCFASLTQDGRIIAAGLGVLQTGFIGLFDIVVDREVRSRGIGRQIVESILSWGKQNGAQHSYLQVMLNNPPALLLYSKIGFVEQYQYWYRIKTASANNGA
jgi:ribosomal protein S18 acetylase RimI-like enzyme